MHTFQIKSKFSEFYYQNPYLFDFVFNEVVLDHHPQLETGKGF